MERVLVGRSCVAPCCPVSEPAVGRAACGAAWSLARARRQPMDASAMAKPDADGACGAIALRRAARPVQVHAARPVPVHAGDQVRISAS
jgi:hypothetical protein